MPYGINKPGVRGAYVASSFISQNDSGKNKAKQIVENEGSGQKVKGNVTPNKDGLNSDSMADKQIKNKISTQQLVNEESKNYINPHITHNQQKTLIVLKNNTLDTKTSITDNAPLA